MKTIFTRASFIPFLLGILSIVCALLIGRAAFRTTRVDFEQQYRNFYLRDAKMLVNLVALQPSGDESTVLEKIRTLWNSLPGKSADEYICIVDKDADLVLHTAHPDSVGRYAGDNPVTGEPGTSETCLADLVESRRDYAGDYISSTGQDQLAAFAAVPDLNWVVGVHRSKQALDSDIEEGMRFSKLGFYLVCGLLMPLSWLLIYLTLRIAQRGRKEAESALIEKTLLVNEVVDSVREGVIVLDSDLRCRMWNPFMEKLSDIPAKDVVGRHPRSVSFLKDEAVIGHMQGALKGENPGTVDFSYVDPKTGRSKWLSAQSSPLRSANEEVIGAIATVRDITERKRFESHLQRTQKMESIGNLAGGIAHDFNNILFPIIGLAELMLEDLPPESLERENAREILNAGLRGSDLVKQILAFSRQSEHKKTPVRVQQILREVLKLGRSTIPADIEIVSDIQKDCGLVMADPTQVHQIAMNLITNAYHAVEEAGGKIVVSLKETEAGGEDERRWPLRAGRYAVLSVSDTGPGIDPAVADKIFEPYFTTKAQGKGTGLGLAVVYGIVKNHRGEVRVQSKAGKGATFNVYLPLMEKSEPPATEKSTPVHPTGSERILLVDDEESIARLGQQMLERLGYRVTSCTSSEKALELFRAEPEAYDLVVTDMTMPRLTGDQLARKMLSIRPGTPIIICTGFSERISRDKAAAMGTRGLLMKPIVSSELASMVRKVIDGDETTAPDAE